MPRSCGNPAPSTCCRAPKPLRSSFAPSRRFYLLPRGACHLPPGRRRAKPRPPRSTGRTDPRYIVQAAHIHQHAVSGNDDPRNGLAFTPDAHWMFDAGLWTAIHKGDHFLIKIAIGRFSESSPHGQCLSRFDGKPLNFHENARLRPAPASLNWHIPPSPTLISAFQISAFQYLLPHGRFHAGKALRGHVPHLRSRHEAGTCPALDAPRPWIPLHRERPEKQITPRQTRHRAAEIPHRHLCPRLLLART